MENVIHSMLDHLWKQAVNAVESIQLKEIQGHENAEQMYA